MRQLVLALFLFAAADGVWAQNVIQEFRGSGSTTTGLFTVPAKWEVRWNARQVVSVAVMSSDGTIVSGGAGVLRGSLFVPVGGQYYLKITDGSADLASVQPLASPVPAGSTSTNTAPVTNSLANTNTTPNRSAPGSVAWHLQVLAVDDLSPAEPLTVFAPYFAMPDAAVVPPTAPPPAPTLTSDELRAMVAIKGNRAQGVGFLIKTADGLCVVTQLHLLAANPNVKFYNSSGSELAPLLFKGAADRDLAYVAVQGGQATLLPVMADASPPPAIGDAVLVPQVGPEGEILSGIAGKLTAVAPDRVDFDALPNVLSSGAPVIRQPGGEVVAVATQAARVDLSNEVAAAWPANPAPGVGHSVALYGMRLQGVAGWDTLQLPRFLDETSFLRQFHEDTRCLDSFLNVKRRRARFGEPQEAGPDRYYENNAKIRTAADLYKKYSPADADRNQSLDAARELLSDLVTVANSGVAQVQALNSSITYVRQQTKEELAYRAALRKQLDFYSDNISRFDNIARYR